MNLTPESVDGARRRIEDEFRRRRRERIDALELEATNLRAIAALLHSKILALRAEVANGDATTVRVRALPSPPTT